MYLNKIKKLGMAISIALLTTHAVAEVVPSEALEEGYTLYYPCVESEDITSILVVNRHSTFIDWALDKAYHRNGNTACELIAIVEEDHPEGWDSTNLDLQSMMVDIEKHATAYDIPVVVTKITDPETGSFLKKKDTIKSIHYSVYREVWNLGYDAGHKKGYEKGFHDGYLTGFDNGYEQGFVPDY
ncbi:hypothetical protein BJAS_P4595 [Bathymodiolus japonicus methanotrophic gill symbiont]|uniref:Yae1 family protein n=1 Tax=Bathymodiolus japonicus methanotrophic gill symbiont TaxID=113269 RepID=UPI001B62EF31|nr:Yae1 family protein [Bathymodiolus japonicus methanotrophic gill symbiont]GFO73660.1 hypothetical protein BJAS_P4595 [Bathymodiolus japonicus methanotrophic gill symbiont]